MKIRRFLCFALALAMALAAAACGGERAGTGLVILYEEDENMKNSYSLLAVDPGAPFVNAGGDPVEDVYINTAGADALITWMLSEAGRRGVSEYGAEEYGASLFTWDVTAPACPGGWTEAAGDNRIIRLSTTTSVNDSGLLGYLLPRFEEATGYAVEVTSVGTGKAIANAKAGNADLILVHAKSQEEAFIEAGFARTVEGLDSPRVTFMYNYFVLAGPESDPAGCAAAPDVLDAFRRIAEGGHTFVSRGDASGTHTKELTLWPAALGITAGASSVKDYGDWYIYSNAGMGACLAMAGEMGAYILTDKATFLTYQSNRDAG